MPARNTLLQLVPLRVHKVVDRLQRRLWAERRPVAVEGGPVNAEPVSLDEAMAQPMAEVQPGEYFGPGSGDPNPWQQRWFRVEVPAPAEGEAGRRFLQWDCRGEHTVYVDGVPRSGLDVAHTQCLLPDRACTLWIECGTYQTCIWWDGKPIEPHGLRFDGAWIALRDQAACDLYYDFATLADLLARLLKRHGSKGDHESRSAAVLGSADPLLRLLLVELNDACDALDSEGPEACAARLKGIYEQLPSEPWLPAATTVGTSHLDLVWMWGESVGETKGIHTAATMLRLLERYPEFRFMWTQPALYKALERRAPELMEQIRARIADGRWEVTGAMWVEAENNVPCGEALARCLVLGQRAIERLRGSISRCVWLPDCFGFNAALPQIMHLSGVEYFFTGKMSWCAVNRFPYDSFVWRGHDGSEVATHLCCAWGSRDYGLETPADGAERYREAGVHPEFLLPSGAGDGGGGTVEAAIERTRRLANLAHVPKTTWGGVEEFFGRMDEVRDRLPVYQGELYLEYHRGVYTTQSEFKRNYRAAERGLQALEAVRVATGAGPIETEPWERVCFAQFHDALPGSSIGLVYEQMTPQLAEVAETSRARAREELAGDGEGMQAFNPLPIPRSVVVDVPEQGPAAVELPPLGGIALGPQAAPEGTWEVTTSVLDNGIVRAEFDANGQLAALSVDGEALRLSAPAGFRIYPDHPHNFDAWDIDHDVFRLARPAAGELGLELVESGPVRAVLRGKAGLGEASTLSIDYVLERGCPHLRVEVDVDWREDHRLLKYHVPTAYRGRHARFGCPVGSILRPQLPGDFADEAMWEVPGSRWAAVMDEAGEAGLALVTEAKYGFSCREGDLGLSLLRAPKDPDSNADRGRHRIRFAVGRHRVTSAPGRPNTAAAAETLYAPVLITRGAPTAPLVEVEGAGTLVPSWVLPAETRKGWVLRLHETMGARGSAVLVLRDEPSAVGLVDLLERPLGEPEKLDARRYRIDYAPYQLISVLVE